MERLIITIETMKMAKLGPPNGTVEPILKISPVFACWPSFPAVSSYRNSCYVLSDRRIAKISLSPSHLPLCDVEIKPTPWKKKQNFFTKEGTREAKSRGEVSESAV